MIVDDEPAVIEMYQAMPGMTGKQLSQALLAIRPDIPIILATGHSDFVTEYRGNCPNIE